MKRVFLYGLLAIFIGSSVYPDIVLNTSKEVFQLCLNTLFPSFLFPLILVRLLSPYHLIKNLLTPFKKIIETIFQMDLNAFEIICTSLFLGFPSASIYIEEYTQFCDKKQYERCMYIVFMASPSFILISLSTIYPKTVLYKIWAIQLLAIFLMLLCTRSTYLQFSFKNENKTIMEILNHAMHTSFQILQKMLAYLVLVNVCMAILNKWLPSTILLPFQILSEFASGCFLLAKLNVPHFFKIACTSILLSYGGLCVHLQLLSSLSKRFKYSTFLKYRICHMFLVIALTLLWI